MPRGGRRPGAGRKPKPKTGSDLARVLLHPSSPVPTTNDTSPIEEFDAPNDLLADERHVWLQQAPHAFKARTLTRATALAFERYCKVVVLERNEAKSSGVGGANHRGLLKQVNLYELQFLLSPNGRAVTEPAEATTAAPESKLAKFRA
jgi:hypothetical protein